ncbi:MAG: hypothetical protein MR601_04185 [Erysipelotrichaceae bacterium]|nr:hypothetical protein [Erysipelotrichaceae bacterium]
MKNSINELIKCYRNRTINIIATLYLLISLIYLYFLSKLNKELMNLIYLGKNDFELIKFKNYIIITYFFIAIGLIASSIFLLVYIFKNSFKDIKSGWDVIVSIIFIILVILMLLAIIKFITIPIFKIILSVAFVGGVIIYGLSN